jgi:hypothetical protein
MMLSPFSQTTNGERDGGFDSGDEMLKIDEVI